MAKSTVAKAANGSRSEDACGLRSSGANDCVMCINIYIYIYRYYVLYIYIYIERERERETERVPMLALT